MWKDTLCAKLNLKQAECLMLSVAVFALVIDIILIISKGARIDVAGYLAIIGASAFMLGLGLIYRKLERSERIASATICAASFIFFSMCLSLFNYLMLPLTRPTIDIPIAQIDEWLGFYWPDVMAWAAQYPKLMVVTKIAYMSTMIQFALLVVVLGLSGRIRDLHVLITSITLTATITICFWCVFPTLGAKTMYIISDDIWNAIRPPVDKAYALDLINLAIKGPAIISPSEIRGLIAFPSYHAVLALTAIYAVRNVKYLSYVFWFINLLILPSIFVHGGHHFLDLPAGFVVFFFGTYVANIAVSGYHIREKTPKIIPA